MSKKEFLKKLFLQKEDLFGNYDFQKLVLDDLIRIGFIYANEHFSNDDNKFANMMMQMSLLKVKSILKLSEGEILSEIKNEFPPIIDIQSISSIYRSLFENYCFFNHLYIKSWTNEEFLILENIWRISSLNQRINLLKNSPLLKEAKHIKKIEAEKNEITKRIKEIESTYIFKQNKKTINNYIKTNKWQITIVENKVRPISWKEIFTNTMKNRVKSERVYQRFSLDAHPTFFSVFQFGNLYKDRYDLERRTTVIFETIQLLCYYLNDFEKLMIKVPEINIESKYLIEILGKTKDN